MEEQILTGIRNVGYEGALLQKGNLKTSIEYGSKNIEYTKLVHFLTKQLKAFSNIDEEVNPITSPEDSAAFVIEISSFLKELNCPYKTLTQGHASDRLQNVEDRQLLLDYLISELMTAQIIHKQTPTKKIEIKLHQTPEATNLQQILITLDFPKPPMNITITNIFGKVTPRVEEVIKQAGGELIGKAFFSGILSDKQWQVLGNLQKALHNEYKIRREMLLTRLDVTIQSFQWSDRTKGKEDYFEKIYKDQRQHLTADPDVDVASLLAARADIAIIEKTSSSNVRKNTMSSLHKVIIGQVPDRGGRTNELAPPPPEMPSWQQRTPGPQGGGRGGYGRGGNQQNSRGGGQSGYGRGNNSFGNNANRGNNNANSSSGFKSSLNLFNNDKKPFSNFDTSLSLYSSSSRFSSKMEFNKGSSNFMSGNNSNSSYSRNSGDNKSNVSSSTSRETFSSSKGGYTSMPFDSAGSYESPNKRSRSNFDTSYKDSYRSDNYSQKRSFDIAGGNEEKGNYGSRANSGTYGGDNRSNYTAYDSAGSYDTNKRAKSYDNFQTNYSTYSEEYVRDAQNNQQYHSRNEYSRGRSNYHRGRGNYR